MSTLVTLAWWSPVLITTVQLSLSTSKMCYVSVASEKVNDTVAAMISTTSMAPCVTAKFSPLARPSISGWVSFLLDKLFQFSWVPSCP